MPPASARPGCAPCCRGTQHAPLTRHGRVAMAAFVGFIVQSNGIHWPFPMTPTFEYTAATPPEQWDALPFEGKMQIIGFVGFLEWWSEFGGQHYMRGGRPGDYPDFKDIPLHEIPPLFDPAGLSKKVRALCIARAYPCAPPPPRPSVHSRAD